ncbi:MAG: DUF2029 domain-containing protein [Acidobacteriota bacterium]|nr:DUF2029 domain-containing protein [Acidobacteriota bacterium]
MPNRHPEALPPDETPPRRSALPRPARLPPLLTSFACWSAALTLLSLAYSYSMGHFAGLLYPYAFPLFHADKPFWDFTVFQLRFQHFHTPAFWDPYNYPFTYPAPTALAFAAFYAFHHALRIYQTVCGLALAAGAALLTRGLVRAGVPAAAALLFSAVVIATSWPLGYLFNRANIEGLVAIIAALGLLAILYRRPWIGATLIGIAGSMKIFPAILLALLLSRRRYKEFAWGCASALLVTALSLKIIGPSGTQAWRHVSSGLRFFQEQWAGNLMLTEVGFDHSAFTLIKIPFVIVDALRHGLLHDPGPDGTYPLLMTSAWPRLQIVLRLYVAGTALAGVALYFLRIRRLPMLNQLLVLSVCAVLLPPVSFDYTLVHLLLPFGLLCIYAADQWRSRIHVPGLRAVMACFVAVSTAGGFVTWHFRWAGQLRAIALLTLLYALLRSPFAPRSGSTLPPELQDPDPPTRPPSAA